jgi:PAS domain S-box-containing protein
MIFIIMAEGIVTVGYLSYKSYERQYFSVAEQQLVAITELKVRELAQWREARKADGVLFSKNPSFSTLVRRFFTQPADTDAHRQLLDWLGKYPANDNYNRIRLLDTQGVVRLSLPADPEPTGSETLRVATGILRSGQIAIKDFGRHKGSPTIYLSVMVPIFDESDTNRPPLGVLSLRIDPNIYLYPFISRWPVPSRTAETLLVRQEGSEAVFLNELRFQTNTALNLRTPLDHIEMPAVQAALGRKGLMKGIDYRGVPVIADIQPIPDSPWVMVARRDVAEVVEEMRARFWQTVVMIASLLFGAAACTSLVWRHQRVGFYREKAKTAEILRESEFRLKQAQQVAKLGHYELDVPSGDWTSSEMLDNLFGIDAAYPKNVAGWSQLIHSEDRKDTLAHFLNHVVMEKQPFDWEYRIVRVNDGSTRWVHGLGQLHFDAAGEVIKMFGVIQDITERKVAEEERARLLHILESSLNEIYVFDIETLRFEYVNRSALRNLGYTLDAMRTMTPLDFKPEFTEESFRQTVAPLLRHEIEQLILTTVHRRADGSLYPVEVHLQLVELSGQHVFLAVIMDITERKQAEDHMAAMMKNLRASNQDLEQFAYVASHDMQEPLRMVTNYMQLLQRRYQDKLDQDANDFIGFAVDGATRMKHLIDSLLEYSQVQTRQKPFEPVDLNQILPRVLRDLEWRTLETGAQITADPLPQVYGDGLQLGLVFQNLIGNALKFRGEKLPEVHIAAEESSGHWKITVRDNGIGIEPQYQARIFKIFQRLHSHAEYPGTGIGLAVCRRIIERHGGETGVESEYGKGSSFWFTLPKKGEKQSWPHTER